ncbi:hypothetical protein ABTO37_19685, partial [Acinetobacter baumannii]
MSVVSRPNRPVTVQPTMEIIMARLPIPALDDAPAASKPILAAVNAHHGVVPHRFRVVSRSPVALTAIAGHSGTHSQSQDF